MKKFIVTFLLFTSSVAAAEAPTAWGIAYQKFEDAKCISLGGAEVLGVYDKNEYTVLLNPKIPNESQMVILKAKATFSKPGSIYVGSARGMGYDEIFAEKLPKTEKVKLRNGFSEAWPVYQESEKCRKLYQDVKNVP